MRLTVESGERFGAKYGRIGFRRNFPFNREWAGTRYATKQVEAYAVEENGWLVIYGHGQILLTRRAYEAQL